MIISELKIITYVIVPSYKDSPSRLVRVTKKGLDVKPIVREKISEKLLQRAYRNFSEK